VVGRRAQRWIERLLPRRWRRRSAPDATAVGVFTARSSPPGVRERPPTAREGAEGAHPGTLRVGGGGAPVAPLGQQAVRTAESEPVAPVSPEPRHAASPWDDLDDAGGDDAPPREDVPGVRVHTGRLERRVGPLELSPTEAVRLATEGRPGLLRRSLPPDPGRDDAR
jgi:hypothetical protein